MEPQEIQSDELRRGLRSMLDDVQHVGEHLKILRWGKPAVVIVPVEWYESARKALGEPGRTNGRELLDHAQLLPDGP